MTKNEINELFKSEIIYLDGATGSNLISAGMPNGVCPEKWILEHPEVIIKLQRDYINAGSKIIYAPTFTCNRIKLKEYGLENELIQMNSRLVKLSKEAAGNHAYVAGNVTMTGKQLSPIGTLSFEELVDVYKEQCRALLNAGVDLFVIETMMSLQETRAAMIAIKEICELPFIVTMTFEKDGKTLYGSEPETVAIVAWSLGASAIGANCSSGPDAMVSIISKMADVVPIPIIAKPNAGLPSLNEDGKTVYDRDVDTYANEMIQLFQAGASILGGCCGTTPEHIKATVNATCKLKINKQKNKSNMCLLSSERKHIAFSLNDPFIIVGERINPTGKKTLQAELREGNMDMVHQFAEEQEANGAKVLDINVGMGGIDEKSMMLKVLEEVGNATSLPLVIDSSHIDVIEAALRNYPGRALINSISMETAKMKPLLNLAKKYGAMFILLPLSDKGLPESLQEKKDIIQTVLSEAYAIGMTPQDVIVDGLVTTVGANPKAALETLETIRYCKELGLATICGLSNISFGLPERININTTFLCLAIEAGLTMAISNPMQRQLVNSALATDLLLNKSGADVAYIEAMNQIINELEEMKKTANDRLINDKVSNNNSTNGKAANNNTSNSISSIIQTTDTAEKLRMAVLKGYRDKSVSITKEAIKEGKSPQSLLNDILLPAIEEVGNLFESGKYFLPQLIASAETMKNAIDYLEPLLKQDSSEENIGTVVIATVKGDIHDIGKNLVSLMLKNYGFNVIDLGKDVPKEIIIKEAIDQNAKIIALSALMTTTMQEMKNVVAYAKEQNCDAKIIIGGAVITEDFAVEIGADGYSKDASDAVKVAKNLINK